MTKDEKKEYTNNKEYQLTITSDKGRLSKEHIEQMVKKAEKYFLYCFNMKVTLKEENTSMKTKISKAHRSTILNKYWVAEKEVNEHVKRNRMLQVVYTVSRCQVTFQGWFCCWRGHHFRDRQSYEDRKQNT